MLSLQWLVALAELNSLLLQPCKGYDNEFNGQW